MKIRKHHHYTNDSSSLVIYVQHLNFYNGILVHGELYAKPNGRLVDYASYRIHDSEDWREYDTLEDALKTLPTCQIATTIAPACLRISHHCSDLLGPL